MKKLALTILGAAFLTIAATSCKKCGTCTVYAGSSTGISTEYCGDDYTNLKDKATYDDVTKIGYKCVDK